MDKNKNIPRVIRLEGARRILEKKTAGCQDRFERRLDKLRVSGTETNSGIDFLTGRLEDDILTRRLTRMETKLYVGNLNYSATEDDLRSLFTQAGEVQSVRVIKDRDTGRSKGFAFVEMSTQAEAEKAISLLNGFSFHDRSLTVNLARPREDRAPNRGGGRQGRSW
jgi:hypothetical protein